MLDLKNRFKKITRPRLQVCGVLFLILLAVLLLWFNNIRSTQAMPAMVAQVYFDGDYRIGDGPWQKIVEGEHISSTSGDVVLRGNLHMLAPNGEYVGVYRGELPVAFYADHINLTFYEGDGEPVSADIENPLFGKSACGESWIAHVFMGSPDDTIEIHIHNPHAFGNENAVDDMLSSTALWSGIEFEKEMLSSGDAMRDVGLFFVIVSFLILGIALFSTLIHIKNSKIIWILGVLILFAGVYFTYSAEGVSFFSESVVSNTTILGASMMFYMLFLSIAILYLLKTTKIVGNFAVTFLGTVDSIFFILPMVSDVLFYDTWLWWVLLHFVSNAVLIVCLVVEFFSTSGRNRWMYIGAILPLVAFFVDTIGIKFGFLPGAVVSKCVFAALFIIAVVMVLKLIPNKINEAAKAKELEMEKIRLNAQLSESRISTMMSQIRPHFIYNTLGSIEQLCKLDPPKAGELVHNFAKYLRGNFGELDNPKPILMSQEMEHVRYYVSIENVRFPDMTFTFEMNSGDFRIPALTVQPIVENAIKHGLMKLQRGGTVRVSSYETDTHYFVSVIDDGAGFDTSLLSDDRAHVGLRNIRERLRVMVGGTLEIESTVGVGTKVLVSIPKEERK